MPTLGSDNDLRMANQGHERRVIQRRIGVALLGMLVMLGILLFRFYSLQVTQHEDFVTRSDRNRIQVQPVAPTRGLIYDRNGILLADNRPSYRLSVIVERVDNLDALFSTLGDLVELSQSDIDRFKKTKRRARSPYQPIPLKLDLSEDEIAKISVNEYRLEGVEVEAELVRYYPHGELLAHTIGYVGRINERELGSFDEEARKDYSATYSIGKIGIEKKYERELLGKVGSQFMETNAHGRSLRVLQRQDPTPGKDIHLYLDLHLQKAAFDALEGWRGAVVAIDVRTGGVVAMVSTPSFNPNLFVTGIGYQDYNALNRSKDLPLYNRTIQAQYPPGSTLKPILGLGGLESGLISPQTRIHDPGFYQLSEGERLYRDWKKWGHGNNVDLNKAITESCDTFFYELAVRLGIDRMHPIGAHFGLGAKTGIDIPNERSGLWPSREWKKRYRRLPWYPGDSLNVSIGQGDVLATPLQLAVMTATFANQGIRYEPHLVSKLGEQLIKVTPADAVQAKAENWDYVNSAMESVVHGHRGTAKGISKGLEYRIAGKTGTAQVIGIAQDEEYDRDKIDKRNWDHALFVSFAPAHAPEIALAVVIENGEHGSSAAAPIARKVFDNWFKIETARKAQQMNNIIATEVTP
ncbi:penicillin-binding protein 2 [Marinagarivorans cellulosilyticus]|uniref:Peptidoglycan D,D-transpeptidase MrdA n=1 Tax=Marinagarivorans cellulosilyticus TaxID=2721545 RepID=A0AAN1WJ74_9GAMM|nr:penicillin-binding protein 2 [Marinagarivorans cellulosilyticus]BCD98605.1 penicillin-binding protein 2 [Marinagarivorans cellulosilyticus]